MFEKERLTRRDFMKGAGAAGALLWLGPIDQARALVSRQGNSTIYKVEDCPVHDTDTRHRGVDALLKLMADAGTPLYQTTDPHPWGGPNGMIAPDDVVLIKVNCQWKCRGTTNTDVVRGLIHRLLQHPEGFLGEIVIIENGQGQGAFDGDPRAWGSYAPWPQIDNGIYINAEEENTLTVDHLVNTVFSDAPVSSYLLDPLRSTFISSSDHSTDGYRKVSDVSYPCFTSSGGHRVELKEGIWTASGHSNNLKLINIPVFKHHDGTGITGALKHTYGILSMSDGYSSKRHYSASGSQCGKMWIEVRSPVLNIIDCIWVSHKSLCGYPPDTTQRTNTLLAGIDPVALDYHASKHIILPLGGNYANYHNPDTYSGLINHLTGAMDYINQNGGIGGEMTHQGDNNIDVVATNTLDHPSLDIKANGADDLISVPTGTPVAVSVSMIAANLAGQRADQWIIAKTPTGWWSYVGNRWQHGIHRLSDSALRDVPQREILNDVLPDGDYKFYIAADDNTDGIVDATWWDAIQVHVGP